MAAAGCRWLSRKFFSTAFFINFIAFSCFTCSVFALLQQSLFISVFRTVSMPSQGAESSGGIVGGGQQPRSLYAALEDKYYNFVDWLEQAGFPAFKLIDPLEMRGVRTFPIFAILLLAALALAGFLAFSPQAVSSQAQFVLKVVSADNPVGAATVRVYGPDGELIVSSVTSLAGVVVFDSLPSARLRFVVSADGFEKAARQFDLSLSRRGSVELNCVSPECLAPQTAPAPGGGPTVFSPDFPNIPITPPVVHHTDNNTVLAPFPDGVVLDVLVRNASSGLPVANASVEVRSASVQQLVARASTGADGLAQFRNLVFGQEVYLIVRANGFLAFNGDALGKKILLNKGTALQTVLLDVEVPGVNTLPTLVRVFDQQDQPTTALAEFYLNDSAIAYLSSTVVAQANFSFPVGTRVHAVVRQPSNPLVATSRVNFNSGDAVVFVKLFRAVESNASTCQVVLGVAGNGPIVLSPGDRLPVQVVFSSTPLSSVNVSCNGVNAFSTCVGRSCSTQCVFDSQGSKTVQLLGIVSCSATRPVSVQLGAARSYTLSALPSVVSVGNSTQMIVSYSDPVPQSSVSVACGDGRFVDAPCNSASRQCTAQCGPYTSLGSKAAFVLLASEKVAATTVIVQGGAECSIAAVPPAAVVGQSVGVIVQFRFSQPVTSAVVECGGGQLKAISCSSSSGTCIANCSFASQGSQSIIASLSSGPSASASCGLTVSVRQPIGNATSCGDAQNTPANLCSGQQPLFCNSAGSLESRASQCGCPGGWRISPADPDFCERLVSQGLLGISSSSIALGQLSNGKITGVSSVLAVNNGVAGVFSVQGGVAVGADQLLSFSGGSVIAATVSQTGQVAGAPFVVGLTAGGDAVIVPIAGGRVVLNGIGNSSVLEVLVVAGGVLVFADVRPDGTIAAPVGTTVVFGVSGGSITKVSLDGGRLSCGDGTAIGSCSLEKPFHCDLDGVKRPDAGTCGCPAGWKVSSIDSKQCQPIGGGSGAVLCADGTLAGACSSSKPVYCSSAGLLVDNATKCGCPAGWKQSAADASQCVPSAGPDSCSDGTATGQCSFAKPLYCDSGLLEPAVASCGCPANFVAQGDQCVPAGPVTSFSTCSDGTSVNSCSSAKPLRCSSTAELLERADLCGCPSGWKASAKGTATCIPVGSADSCIDGTFPGACSSSRPLYCDNGLLEARAGFCGCPAGWKESLTSPGQCVQISGAGACEDGTLFDACSAGSKPLLCSGGLLVERAGVCGCPSGFSAQGDSCACSSSLCSQACSDGTGRGACSLNAPFYCSSAGDLVEKASACGCPDGFHIDLANADKCVKTSVASGVCVDGTLPGACSISSKPLYCFGGQLIERSAQCGCPANFVVQGDACVPASVPSRCSDNTPVNSCSSSKPQYCNSLGVLVQDAGACGCPAGWKASAQDSTQCVPSASNGLCADGTPTGSCAQSKPLYCGNGLLEENAPACGCPSGFVASGNSCLPFSIPSNCADGSALNSCSASKPLFCNQQGGLVERASQCGCPSGWQASASDSSQCVPVGVTQCAGGVAVGACSPSKPLYCDNGLLQERASQCGCPTDFDVVGDSCIPKASPKACVDGTSLNSCSRFEPLYCGSDALLSTRADLCGCPYGWRPDPADSTQCVAQGADGICSDGTRSGVCSLSAKPLYCLGGEFISKASECGCPAGFNLQGDLCVPQGPPSLCSDGTVKNSCSRFKPLFCSASAQLLDKASYCGCAEGWVQSTSSPDQCVPAISVPSCFDGTPANACSSSRPYYCASDLTLSSKASSCGCPDGLQRSGELCVSIFSCADGTLVGACSQASGKPLYCGPAGLLQPRAFQCGCNAGFHVDSTNPDQCVPNSCADTGSCGLPCADGTASGACSASKPLLCNLNSELVENAVACGCPANFIASGSTCVAKPKACVDGTASNACSANKPYYCNSDGLLEQRASSCGCPAGYAVDSFDANSCVKQGVSCVDGTVSGACSASKPFFCDSGQPVERASACGCPANFVVQGDSCVPRTCSDGTAVGVCSAAKPLYCNSNFELVDRASQCGCPAGGSASGDACGANACGSTASGACLPSKPLWCDDGSPQQRADLCGCPAGKVPAGSQCVSVSCIDGTARNSCSSSKPLYCDALLELVVNEALCGDASVKKPCGSTPSGSCLSSKPLWCYDGTTQVRADICGCPAGLVQAGLECKAVGECSDGTVRGSCSASKPLFCPTDEKFDLIEKASQCGCPIGNTVVGDACGSTSCDSTPSNACLPSKPLWCNAGVPVGRADLCGCPAGFTPVGEECVVNCDDGTARGACSASKPLLCPLDGTGLVEKASVCGCPSGSPAVGDSCGNRQCAGGVASGSCSPTKPLYCSDASFEERGDLCGCPAGYDLSGSQCLPRCSDGTSQNSCSPNQKPYYCDGNANLLQKASLCGCAPGFKPDAFDADKCVPSNPDCSDGTVSGACSSSASAGQPYLCEGGALVLRASACGCPAGFVVSGDQCVPLPSVCLQDGTPFGQCSNSADFGKPFYCNGGVLEPKSGTCGCKPGFEPNPSAPGQCRAISSQFCADGRTSSNSCKLKADGSLEKPLFCTASLAYVDKASVCGCPADLPVVVGDSCFASGGGCSDGTPIGACSSSKPLYCNGLSQLVANADGSAEPNGVACACPAGKIAAGSDCIDPVGQQSCTIVAFPSDVLPSQQASLSVGFSGFAQVPLPSQVTAFCDSALGQVATLSYNSVLGEFVGSCTYSSSPGPAKTYLYNASITSASGTVACSVAAPGSVRVRAARPTSCIGTGGAAISEGGCDSIKPLQCAIQGNDVDGFSTSFPQKASVCGCSAGYHSNGDLCTPDVPPVSCIDGTPAVNTTETGGAQLLGCSSSVVQGKPFLCLRNPSNAFIVDFDPRASVCGCPAGKVASGESCVTPSVSLATVVSGGTSFTVLSPVSGNVFLSGYNFPILNNLSGLQISCGSSDGSPAGTLSFSAAGCQVVSGGSVSCPFTCTYPVNGAGSKRVAASYSIAGSSFPASPAAFIVEGFPSPVCSIFAGGVNPPSIVRSHLGQNVSVNVSFRTPFNSTGFHMLLAGPASSTYGFSCGLAVSPLTGLPAEILPQPQINCNGSDGYCTAVCAYDASKVDLQQTSSTNARFDAFTSTPSLAFSCVGPTVQFDDTPAAVRVNVWYCLEREFNANGTVSCKARGVVPGATVSLLDVSAGSQLCDSQSTPANGSVVFSQCVSQDGLGSRSNLLKGTAVKANVQVPVYDAGNNSIYLVGSSSGQLILGLHEFSAAQTTYNDLDVAVDFQYAAISMDLVDRLLGIATPALDNAVSVLSCPSVNVAASPLRVSGTMRGNSSCSGTSCTLGAKAILGGCLINITAPGYRNAVALPTSINTPGSSIAIHYEMVPNNFPANSFNTLLAVYDLEGASGFFGALDLSALSLKKGFRYKVQTLLETILPTGKVAAFFSASSGGEAGVYNSSLLVGPAAKGYLLSGSSVGHGIAQVYNASNLCSPSALSYGDLSAPTKFQWVELQANNSRADANSLAPSGQGIVAEYDVLPIVGAGASSSRLSTRSYTENSTGLPRFVLNAYDPDAIDALAHPSVRLPLCTAAVQDSYNYSLVESTRACSGDFAYCIENQFRQAAVNPFYSRGDGFYAYSSQSCDALHADQCNAPNVTAEFVLTNADAANGIIDSSYSFSMNAVLGRYRVEQIVFNNPAGGQVALANVGDGSGALSAKSENSFTVNLGKIYAALGGVTTNPRINGIAFLAPLAPTNGARSAINFSFSSASGKRASLSQWTVIAPNTGVITPFGTILSGLVEQPEQFDSSENATPYGFVRSQALSNTSAFDAAASDCFAGQKGWPCPEVEFKFSSSVFQKFNSARLLYNDSGFAFQLSGYSFNLTPADGSPVVSSGRIAARGFSANVVLGRALVPGDALSAVLYATPPPVGAPQNLVSVGLVNGSVSESLLQLSGLVSASRKYGVVRLVARDALTGALVSGTVFSLQYGGVAGSPAVADLSSCNFNSIDSCAYRLRPLSWRQPSCSFDGSVDGSGCIRVVSAPAGYLPAFVQPIVEDSVNSLGAPVSGSVAVGSTREIVFYLLKPVSDPSSIQLVSVSRALDGKRICEPYSTDPTVPDCLSGTVYLQRGEKYSISLQGTMKQSEVGGVFLSAGSGVSQAQIYSAPTYLSTDVSVTERVRCVFPGTRTADVYCYTPESGQLCVVLASNASNYCEVNVSGKLGSSARWHSICPSGISLPDQATVFDGSDEQVVFDCSGGATSTPVPSTVLLNGFAGGSQTGVCTPFDNLVNFRPTLPDLSLDSSKWNWLEVVSNTSGMPDLQFKADYSVAVDASASGDLPVLLNSFISRTSVLGQPTYFRSPPDSVLGNDWSKPEKNWCSADSLRINAKAIAASARCNSFACVSLQFEQGGAVTSLESDPYGFGVVSRDLSEHWTLPPYPDSMKIRFFVDILQNSPGKKVNLKIDQPENLNVRDYRFTRLCAPGDAALPATFPSPGQISFDVSACANISDSADIVGEFDADGLTGGIDLVEKLVTLSVSYSDGGSNSIKHDSAVRIVPPALSISANSIIEASGFQKFTNPAVPSLSCGSSSGCGNTDFLSTFNINCEQESFIDNTFTGATGTKCSASWLELNYTITSRVPSNGAHLHFEIPFGETTIPNIPDSLAAISGERTEAAKVTWVSGGTSGGLPLQLPDGIVCSRDGSTACTISPTGKSIDIDLGSVGLNSQLVFTVRLNPRSAGALNPSLTFSNGEDNLIRVPMLIKGPPIAYLSRSDWSVVYPQFPCGRANLLLSAATNVSTGNAIANSSCSNATLVIDPVAPFDALPLAIDQTFRDRCIGTSSLPLFALEPINPASLPSGSRAFDISDLELSTFSDSIGGSYFLVRFNGMGFGQTHQKKIIQGNSIIWPGESGAIPPDTEIGRVYLKILCSQSGTNLFVPIILRTSANYRSSIDAGEMFFSDKPHQLVWSTYNGQGEKVPSAYFPAKTFNVRASNEPNNRIATVPFVDASNKDSRRVNYFVTNRPSTALRMSGSYPIAIYPEIPVSQQVVTSGQLPDNRQAEANGINMAGNVLLLHLNEQPVFNNTVVADSSGTGSNGRYNTGNWSNSTKKYDLANKSIEGKFLSAMKFDGKDDRIVVPNSAPLMFANGTSITLSAWIKPNAFPAAADILSKGRYNNSNNGNYGLRTVGQKLEFYYFKQNGAIFKYTTSANVFAPVTAKAPPFWYHLAAVYTFGQNNSMALYVSGVNIKGVWSPTNGPKGTDTPYTNSSLAFNSPLHIGAIEMKAAVPVEPFNGTMDEIAIWNRALLPDEIRMLASRFSTGLFSGFDDVERLGGVVLNGSRPGNLASKVLQRALASTGVSANFSSFVAALQDPSLAGSNVCTAINQRSYIQSLLPAFFTEYAKGIASETAFRRTEPPSKYIFTGFVKRDEPFYCGADLKVSLNSLKCGCPAGFSPTADGNCQAIGYRGPMPPGIVTSLYFDGDALDSSGYGNNGTLGGGNASAVPQLSSDCKVGGCYSFDGANDLIELSTPVASQPFSDSFSFSFWARPSSTRASTPESTSGITGASGQRYAVFPTYAYATGDPYAVAGVSVGINGVSVFEHQGGYLPSLLVYDTPISNWVHVTVVYQDDTPKLYLDGELVRTGLHSAKHVKMSRHLGYMDSGSNYGHYAGQLDEFKVWNRSLSDSEVRAAYNVERIASLQVEDSAQSCADGTPGESCSLYAPYYCNKDLFLEYRPGDSFADPSTPQWGCGTAPIGSLGLCADNPLNITPAGSCLLDKPELKGQASYSNWIEVNTERQVASQSCYSCVPLQVPYSENYSSSADVQAPVVFGVNGGNATVPSDSSSPIAIELYEEKVNVTSKLEPTSPFAVTPQPSLAVEYQRAGRVAPNDCAVGGGKWCSDNMVFDSNQSPQLVVDSSNSLFAASSGEFFRCRLLGVDSGSCYSSQLSYSCNAPAGSNGLCETNISGITGQVVNWTPSCGAPVQQISIDGRAREVAFECKVPIYTREYDQCVFAGSTTGGSCISSKGSCVAPAGSTSCSLLVEGAAAQSVAWTSSCSSSTKTSVIDGQAEKLVFDCSGVTDTLNISTGESVLCKFAGSYGGETCYSTKGSCTAAAGSTNCSLAYAGASGDTIGWYSSCAGGSVPTAIDGHSELIAFDCSPRINKTEAFHCQLNGSVGNAICSNPSGCSLFGANSCDAIITGAAGLTLSWPSQCTGGSSYSALLDGKSQSATFNCAAHTSSSSLTTEVEYAECNFLNGGSSPSCSVTAQSGKRAPVPTGLAASLYLDGDANDSSGNSNGGSLGGVTCTDSICPLTSGTSPLYLAYPNCKVGSCYSFDGVNDFVNLSSTAFSTISNSFTVSFWAKPTATRDVTVENNAGVSGTAGQRYALWPIGFTSTDTALAGISVGTNGVSVFEHKDSYLPSLLVYPVAITDWTLVTVVYSGKTPKLYLDDKLKRTGKTSTMQFVHPGNSLGYQAPGGADYGHYAGGLDEFKVWNRALSGSEVNALYNSEVSSSTNVKDVSEVCSPAFGQASCGVRVHGSPGQLVTITPSCANAAPQKVIMDGQSKKLSFNCVIPIGPPAPASSATSLAEMVKCDFVGLSGSGTCAVNWPCSSSFTGTCGTFCTASSAAGSSCFVSVQNSVPLDAISVTGACNASAEVKQVPLDGSSRRVAFDCTGSYQVSQLKTSQEVECMLYGSSAGAVCTSSKGSCTIASPGGSCILGISGIEGEVVSFTSDCSSTVQAVPVDGVSRKIAFDCRGPSPSIVTDSEYDECVFAGLPTGSIASCSSTPLPFSCQSNTGSCAVVSRGTFGQSLNWTASCSVETKPSVIDGQSNRIVFNCGPSGGLSGDGNGTGSVQAVGSINALGSKSFTIPTGSSTAGGLWVLRVKAAYTDLLGSSIVSYSPARQVVVSLFRERACFDRLNVVDVPAAEAPYSCLLTGNTARCSSECVNGKLPSSPIVEGPGVVSGVEFRWKNASNINLAYDNNSIIDRELYNGAPYKHFVDASAKPFTYSFPLMLWGSSLIPSTASPNWNVAALTSAGYSLDTSTCTEGIGFYELDARTTNGNTTDWQLSARLASLPLNNYLLNTEPLESGTPREFDNTTPIGFYPGGGTGVGCSIHTENTNWNWTTIASTASQNGGFARFWVPSSPLQGHEKPLCNIKMATYGAHTATQNGAADCVQMWKSNFGGNCGLCQPPGCFKNATGSLLPICGVGLSTDVARCTDLVNCIHLSKPLNSTGGALNGSQCICKSKVSLCGFYTSENNINRTLTKQGYSYAERLNVTAFIPGSGGTNAYYCGDTKCNPSYCSAYNPALVTASTIEARAACQASAYAVSTK